MSSPVAQGGSSDSPPFLPPHGLNPRIEMTGGKYVQVSSCFGLGAQANSSGADLEDEETEAQREEEVHPVSHSKLVAEVGLEPMSVRP